MEGKLKRKAGQTLWPGFDFDNEHSNHEDDEDTSDDDRRPRERRWERGGLTCDWMDPFFNYSTDNTTPLPLSHSPLPTSSSLPTSIGIEYGTL